MAELEDALLGPILDELLALGKDAPEANVATNQTLEGSNLNL
jgi:hypothetical protein